MTYKYLTRCTLILSILHEVSASWVTSCAKEGALNAGGFALPFPPEGSLPDTLLSCMVEHVVLSPFPEYELPLQSGGAEDDWCLPDDFLSQNRSCMNLSFNIFEPLQHCMENDVFQGIASNSQTIQMFNEFKETTGGSNAEDTLYLSSLLANAMCILLDGLRSASGKVCLEDMCRNISNEPSFTPTVTPSIEPSLVPTPAPSDNPSFSPTFSPSTLPSSSVSDFPSNFPSLQPSFIPSIQNSLMPLKSDSILEIEVNLRIVLEGVGSMDVPPSDSFLQVLQAASEHIFGHVSELEYLEINHVTRDNLPEGSMVVVSLRIVVSHDCTISEDCLDPLAGRPFATNILGTLRDAIANGHFATAITAAAKVYEVPSLLGTSPNPNSANIMTYSTSVKSKEMPAQDDNELLVSGTDDNSLNSTGIFWMVLLGTGLLVWGQ